MAALGPLLKGVAKYGVKYGPHAKAAWDVGGEHAKEAVQKRLAQRRQRHAAVDKARSVVAGSVLRVVHGGEPVWVVYSGDRPVDAYPTGEVDLDALTRDADLGRRQTPAEIDERTAAARARRAATRAKGARRGRPGPGELG